MLSGPTISGRFVDSNPTIPQILAPLRIKEPIMDVIRYRDIDMAPRKGELAEKRDRCLASRLCG